MGRAVPLPPLVTLGMVTVTKMRTALVTWSVARTTAGNIIQQQDQHRKL